MKHKKIKYSRHRKEEEFRGDAAGQENRLEPGYIGEEAERP
jgi:hypothetical protein